MIKQIGANLTYRAPPKRHNSRNSRNDHFGLQKGRWARNGPFPFKIISGSGPEGCDRLCRPGGQQDMIKQIGANLTYRAPPKRHNSRNSRNDHFGPQKGRWARNGPFPSKNGFFLVYSTIAEIRGKFDHFGAQKGRDGPETARFLLKTAFSWSIAQ